MPEKKWNYAKCAPKFFHILRVAMLHLMKAFTVHVFYLILWNSHAFWLVRVVIHDLWTMNPLKSSSTESDNRDVRLLVNESSENSDEVLPQRRSGLPLGRVSWRARPPELDAITTGIQLKRRRSSGKVLECLLDGQTPRTCSQFLKISKIWFSESKILSFWFWTDKVFEHWWKHQLHVCWFYHY